MSLFNWLWLYPLCVFFLIVYFMHLLFHTKQQKTLAKRVYYLSLTSGVLWIISEGLLHGAPDPVQASLFITFAYVFASIMVSLVALTSLILSKENRLLKGLAFLPVLSVLAWIPSLTVRKAYFGWVAQPGMMMFLWASSLSIPLILLCHAYRKFKSGITNKRLRKKSMRFAEYSFLLILFGTVYYLYSALTLTVPFFSPLPVAVYLLLTYPLFGSV